jgi:hypothetical protein
VNMSKTLYIVLGFALVWLAAWVIAGYFMREAGLEKLALSEHLSSPAMLLEPGADVRVEGTIVDAPAAAAAFSGERCLAAVTYISAFKDYRDSRNKPATESSHVATLRVGPENIEIAVGDKRIRLPLERWAPKYDAPQYMPTLPPHLGVTEEQIAIAKGRLQHGFSGFSVSEGTIDAGTHVFVAGRLENGDGPLRLGADRVLDRIELYQGTQEDFVEELSGSGGGLSIAGWILGAGLGPLPLAVIGLVLLVMRRRRSAAALFGQAN